MNFVIYGGGSLGLLFGYYLSKKHNVSVIAKKNRVSAIKNNGLIFRKDGFEDKIELKIYSNAKDINVKPDVVVFAVKSFDVDNSLKDIKNHYANTPIVTLQNGIYTEDALLTVFDKHYIYPSAVLIGSKIIDDNTIFQFMDNGMKLGCLDKASKETLKKLADIFNDIGIKTTISDNIMKDKWHKFMFYCAAATINSLTGTRNLEDENLRWVTSAVLDEIVNVSQNLDLDFDIVELRNDVFDFIMNFKPKSWSASVGEDLRKGKKTEIDYLNGYVVKLANRFNVDVPFNRLLVSFVKTIEKTGYFKNEK